MSPSGSFHLNPSDVHSPGDLISKLAELYDSAGKPQAAEISARVRGVISEATARQIILKNVSSGQRDEVAAFAAALDGAPSAWRVAYDRAFPEVISNPPSLAPPAVVKARWIALGVAGGLVLSLVFLLAIPSGRHALGIGTPSPSRTPPATGVTSPESSPVTSSTAAVPASPLPPSRPSGPESWHTTMVKGDNKNPDQVTVDQKLDGGQVGVTATIPGKNTNLCCGRSIWIIIHPLRDSNAYPDPGCESDGSGTLFRCVNMQFGDQSDKPGNWFSIVVVVLEQGEVPKFEQTDNGTGFPIARVPGEVRSISNTIWVQRK